MNFRQITAAAGLVILTASPAWADNFLDRKSVV